MIVIAADWRKSYRYKKKVTIEYQVIADSISIVLMFVVYPESKLLMRINAVLCGAF